MAPEIHPAVQWCEDTDGEKKNAARANRPERGGSRERESEMGNFLLVWKMFLILGLTFNRPAQDLASQDG